MKKKMSIMVFFSTLFLLFLFGVLATDVFGAPANREFTEVAKTHLKTTEELYIEKVLEGGPADKAGLQKGDQILAVDDQPVARIDEIVRIIDAHSPDDRLQMSIQRESETHEVEVTLGKNEQEKAFLGVVLAFEMTVEEVQEVQEVQELKEIDENADLAQRFLEWVNRWPFQRQVTDNNALAPDVSDPAFDFDKAQLPEGDMLQGAIIREVEADSLAEEAGLQKNDVITAINDQPVDSLDTFHELLQAHATNERMRLTVERRGESETLNIELEIEQTSDNSADLGLQVGFVWHVEHTEGSLPEGFDDELPVAPHFEPPHFEPPHFEPPHFEPPHFDPRQMPTPPDFPAPPFGNFPKPRFP